MTGSAAAAAAESRVFHTLDALRGIAAVGVVMFHMAGLFSPIAVPGGYLAVDLFFMMSGVVLSHAYESRFRAGMGTIGFMRARLIRLYPLYLLGLLLGVAVTLSSMLGRNSQHWGPQDVLQALVLGLLFLPNFSAKPVDQLFPLNIPCWSLFLELLVNLLFVAFWPLLTSRRLVGVCVLTGIAVCAAIVHQGNIDLGSTGSSLAIGLARTIFGFGVGVLIARRVQRTRARVSNIAVLTVMLVVAIAIAGAPVNAARAIWDAVCVLLVFPLVVLCGTLVDPGHRIRRIATFLGVTSYAIYVLHSPLSSILNSVSRHFGTDASPGFGAPYLGLVALAALLVGCWLVDRFFDMPVRRLLNRVVPKTTARATP